MSEEIALDQTDLWRYKPAHIRFDKSEFSTYGISDDETFSTQFHKFAEMKDELSSSVPLHELPEFLVQLSEKSVIEKLRASKNEFLPALLEDVANEIRKFVQSRYNTLQLGIGMLKDPEDPDWEVFLILINANFGFESFRQKLEAEDEIEDLIESVIDKRRSEVHLEDVAKIEEINRSISVIINEKKF